MAKFHNCNCQGVFFFSRTSRRPLLKSRKLGARRIKSQVTQFWTGFLFANRELHHLKIPARKKMIIYGEITIRVIYYIIMIIYATFTSSTNLEIGMVPQRRKLLSFFFGWVLEIADFTLDTLEVTRVLLSIFFSRKLTNHDSWKITEFSIGDTSSNCCFSMGCIILEPGKLTEHKPFNCDASHHGICGKNSPNNPEYSTRKHAAQQKKDPTNVFLPQINLDVLSL